MIIGGNAHLFARQTIENTPQRILVFNRLERNPVACESSTIGDIAGWRAVKRLQDRLLQNFGAAFDSHDARRLRRTRSAEVGFDSGRHPLKCETK